MDLREPPGDAGESELVGRTGYLEIADLKFVVQVLAVLPTPDGDMYQVTPVGGAGRSWVWARQVNLNRMWL
jgi:hypothetical protein